MGRALTYALDEAMQRPKRRPHWKVFLYDTRSTADTIGSIVRDLVLDPLTGPLDISDHVAIVDVVEKAGDFASSGIPSSMVTISITDDTPGSEPSRWDPQVSADDTTAPARFLRKGNVLRLVEGDLDVDPDDWPITFTGKLVGQAGVDRGRAEGESGRSLVTMAASSREAPFLNLDRDSDHFPRLTTYLDMADQIAREDMQLDADEIDLSAWGSMTTGLKMQFVQQSPLVTIAQLMFVDGFMPRFTGEGKLSQTFADISKAPTRIYLDESTLRHIVKPYVDADPVNHVRVVGIEGVKTEVVQPRQGLADVSLTTGFFTSDEEVDAYWTPDKTQLAKNVQLEVQLSVNGGLSWLGGGESFTAIYAETSATLLVGATLKLSTGFAPYIIIFLTYIYIVLAIIPDLIEGFGVGVTTSVGRLIQAIALAAIEILMTKIGRGKYTFSGEPVEYVYREITGIAERDGVLTEDLNELTVENHLVQTQAQADASALLVLFRQQARANPRNVTGLHDLALEPHDIFEISDGRRFMIEQIQRRLVRNAKAVLAAYSTFEVTPGLEP